MPRARPASKRRSAWSDHPDYEVDLSPAPERVHVEWNHATIADSRRALYVRETNHAPVLYVPREDVRMELLERTRSHTFCPFKGEASYFSIRVGDRVAVDAVWTYEDPFPEVAGLKDHLAFWRERMPPE